MAYKDSFVDEYPYLVYSDDPEAVGDAGGGGGDIGMSWDETPLTITNTAEGLEFMVYVVTDANASAFIASFDESASIGVSKNAFVAIPMRVSSHTLGLAIEDSDPLEPVSTVDILDSDHRVYALNVDASDLVIFEQI